MMKVALDYPQMRAPQVSRSVVPQTTISVASQQKKDSLSIGQQARQLFESSNKASNQIESFMKRREQLQEMRSNLIERTLEGGQSLSAIREQLEEFDKQIQDVEMNMLKQQMKEQEQALEKMQQKAEEQQPKTSTEQMIANGTSLTNLNTMSRVKRSLDGERNVLQSEIKLDEGRGVSVEAKTEKLASIEQRISKLNESIQTELEQQLEAPEQAEEVKESEEQQLEQEETVQE